MVLDCRNVAAGQLYRDYRANLLIEHRNHQYGRRCFFTEYVADFYRIRLQFKTMVCDSLVNSISRSSILERSQNFINFDYLTYGIMTTGCLNNMRQIFLECQQMMHVTDEEVLAYRNERKRIESRRSEGTDDMVESLKKLRQLQDDIDKAKLKYQ